MKTVIITGKPVWVEEYQLTALEDHLHLKFERIEGKEVPDFHDLWVSTYVGGFPGTNVILRMDPKHLRIVTQWLSRLNTHAQVEREDTVLLAYQNGGVTSPFNTPFPSDIDSYTREQNPWS